MFSECLQKGERKRGKEGRGKERRERRKEGVREIARKEEWKKEGQVKAREAPPSLQLCPKSCDHQVWLWPIEKQHPHREL